MVSRSHFGQLPCCPSQNKGRECLFDSNLGQFTRFSPLTKLPRLLRFRCSSAGQSPKRLVQTKKIHRGIQPWPSQLIKLKKPITANVPPTTAAAKPKRRESKLRSWRLRFPERFATEILRYLKGRPDRALPFLMGGFLTGHQADFCSKDLLANEVCFVLAI
ncbi:hypothetical protein MFFC18_45050 [Mariniblastus fucicola]|uniref:Uncharacterized protein n=1 Tax=Mariniblastus fucicola TaxID=980251 RepID=A0A5B9PEC7_9BACT|nr:hypothetical protein MFFC18_45050 [Mariniblastus fucicola]